MIFQALPSRTRVTVCPMVKKMDFPENKSSLEINKSRLPGTFIRLSLSFPNYKKEMAIPFSLGYCKDEITVYQVFSTAPDIQ